MDVRLLTPFGALLALTALAPLAVYVVRERRLRVLRRTLGLAPLPLRSRLPLVAALAAVPALLGLAAAQPVVETTRDVPERTDAQAFVVLDVSRSMLASEGPGAPTRFERARELARDVRAAFPEIPFGVATLTDRVLPHLFPSLGVNSFTATIDRAIGIDRPPPDRTSRRATALNALAELGRVHFFGAQTARRIAVVVTDGETVPVSDLGAFRQRLVDGRVSLIFVHVWHEDEAIFENADTVNEAYKPDPTASRSLRRIAGAVDGALFTEGQAREVAAEIRRLAGEGRSVPHGNELRSIALAPHAAAAAFLPLLLLLRRRNF